MTRESGLRVTGRIGVREVAARAGVSTQTVSRVINDRPNIRPETRERVLAAMADLDYRVNNAARALGTATTRTLGVLASDATLYGPSAGIAALEAAARAADRWMATAYADAADAASVRAGVEHLLAQGVDGLIVLAAHVRTLQLVRDAAGGLPVSALHAGAGARHQREGAALAVAHLVELGHRRIGRLAGPGDWTEATARDQGVDDALAAAGLVSAGRWEGDWSAAAGYAAAPAIADAVRGRSRAGGSRDTDGRDLADLAAPTAIVVANDQMALGLIAGLAQAGLSVPGDVSVTGFDDTPDAAFYRPALTTVRIDLEGEARRAVAEVLGLAPGDRLADAAPVEGVADAAPVERVADAAPADHLAAAAPSERVAAAPGDRLADAAPGDRLAGAAQPPILVARASTAPPTA